MKVVTKSIPRTPSANKISHSVNNNNGSKPNLSDDSAMQEELKNVLRMRERRSDLDIHKTPQIYIHKNSCPTDVANWLRAKEFSPLVLQRLAGLDGDTLFDLTTEQLDALVSIKESRRLASQIKLQKSVSGYKTARSSELQEVLSRARPKTET